MKNKKLINEVRQLQRIAGLLKEEENLGLDLSNNPLAVQKEVLTKFREAGIDLNKDCVVEYTHFGREKPPLVLRAIDVAKRIQKEVTLNRQEDEGKFFMSYEFPSDFRSPEEYGGDNEELDGYEFKLAIGIEDSHTYWIWQ
jgi:hypothetical protein